MKSRVKKRVIALMLCMVMVLSSGISTLAEGDAGTPEATEEVSSTNDESAVNTEPDTAVVTESQSRSNTAVETEETADANIPVEAAVQPKTAEAAPAESTEADTAVQAPAEETQTQDAAAEKSAADVQSTEQTAENGEAVQDETQTPETQAEKAQTAEDAAQPYEGKYEDDTVKITVNAEAGIVPEGAKLSVTPIEKKEITDDMTDEEKAETEKINDQYDLTKKKLNEDSEENEATMEGFLAYDISFLVNGEEVEPNGDVNVVMEFQEAAIPEGVSEDADVTVKHLKEDETAEDGVTVEDMADKAEVQTTEKAEVEKVELTADSFSIYTINWSNKNWSKTKYVRIHYVDKDGKDIEGRNDFAYKQGADQIDLSTSEYRVSIAGYTYSYTTVRYYNNTVRTEAIRRNNDGEIQYRSNGQWRDIEENWENGTRYYDVYIVYEVNSSGGDTGDTGEGGQLGAPEHRKYIEENERGEDYTLTLDVKGERGQASGIDVLLVIDKSGSMDDDYGDPMETLQKTVAEDIVPAVFENNNTVNRIAAVSFSSDAHKWRDISTQWYGADGQQAFINAVNGIGANGGTNWELGMMNAEAKLEERANSNNQKIVIFLSDGAPGYYYDRWETEDGIGSPDPSDEDDIDDIEDARDAAVDYVANDTNYLKNATIYSVYLTEDTKDSMVSFANELKKKGIDAKSVDGTDIQKSLTNLINSIVAPAYTDVVIQDTLSKYVELIKDREFKVIKKTSDGNEITLNAGTDYTLEPKEVSLDDGTKTTQITLKIKGELDDGATYSLSYRVKPTQAAIDEYIEEGGYPHTGDLNTDATGNTSSSGQKGFYSNDNATLTYSENGGDPDTVTYDKPVVQIDTGTINIPEHSNPIDGSITKTMGEVTEDGKYPITLEVKTRREQSSEEAKVDVILVIDVSNSMAKNNRLVNTKIAAKEFVKNFVGAEGSVSETHRVGIVTFGSSGSILTYGNDQQYFSGSATTIDNKIDAIRLPGDKAGGTNTEAGFTKALELAGETSNDTYVIFLTDGVPTYHGTNSEGGYLYSTKTDFNNAVEKALKLKAKVAGIYTIGLLDGANDKELDIARTLLASDNPDHKHQEYTYTYKLSSSSAEVDRYNGTVRNWKYTWDKSQTYNYSDGYFEVTNENASTELTAIWTQLATLINNRYSGSTGSGWIVTDEIAEYTNFLSLAGAKINDYTLTLAENGTQLVTEINGDTIIVATYKSGTITWTLNDVLAEKSIRYNKGIDYTYRLTYYVDFDDSGETELNPTNTKTYVTTNEDPQRKIYPDKMPFFVNVVGTKKDKNTEAALEGATFKVYRDENKKELIGEFTSNSSGHFAFQLGQSDFELQDNPETVGEDYIITVYLEETKAPEGHIVDTQLHPLTISVSNVTYVTESSGEVAKGTPSGSVAISYSASANDLVSISDDALQINYKNESRPDWAIVKWNKNNHTQLLTGAHFELYEVTEEVVDTDPSYTAESQNGFINSWTDIKTNDPVDCKLLPTGTYLLKETEAPDGYRKSEVEWLITVTETGVTVTAVGNPVSGLTDTEKAELGLNDDVIYFAFDNEMAYDLPSTGGPGIYWYMLGGVLLMMAGSLLVYKKRRGEVLRRK